MQAMKNFDTFHQLQPKQPPEKLKKQSKEYGKRGG